MSLVNSEPFFIFRLRVLGNEVEILQNNATQRTKQLKKAELNHAKHCSERDALRNERAKMNSSQAQIDVQISSRKLEIERLNLMSQRAEEDARNLLVQYEKVSPFERQLFSFSLIRDYQTKQCGRNNFFSNS